ncbi:MAG: preprotein translocase subunit YajC [Gaiellaceae bacterium]
MPAYLFILVMLAVVWVFLIRPRQRQMRQQQRQVAALQVGDEIVTAGGLYGTVKAIENDEVHVEIARDIVVRVARRAVAAVLTEKGKTELDAAEPDEEGDATLPSA